MIDNLWKIYNANKEWIKFADTKAIAFIAIIGIFFNILFNVTDEILILSNFNIVKILYVISIGLLSLSLLLSICCLYPRINRTEVVENNLIYYKSINDNFKNEKEYYDAVKGTTCGLDEQLIAQNYQLAKVATTKYSIVKWALILFATGFVVIMLLMVLLKMG